MKLVNVWDNSIILIVLSIDNLHIADMGGTILTVTSKKNPKHGVVITSISDQEMMSDISLMDQSGTSASFIDRNGDGIWDDINFSKDKVKNSKNFS